MSKIRCSLSYHQAKVGDITTIAGKVREGVFTNTTPFPSPPMTQVAFQALITDFQDKRDIYKAGGSAAKGPYEYALSALMAGMDQMAEYVDDQADGDPNMILLGGFVPTKGSRSDTPAPVQATGVRVKAGETGQLLAECDKQDVATGYGAILTVGEPLPPEINIDEKGQLYMSGDAPTPAASSSPLSTILLAGGIIDFNPNRKKVFTGLTRGVTYYIVFFAINNQGVGKFSVPVPGWVI